MKIDTILSSKWIKALFALSAAAFIILLVTLWFHIGLGETGALSDVIPRAIAGIVNVCAAFTLALYYECKLNILNKIFEVKSKACAITALFISAYMVLRIAVEAYKRAYLTILAAFDSGIGIITEQNFPYLYENLAFILHFVYVIAGIISLFFVYTAIYAIVIFLRKWPISRIWNAMDRVEQVYFTTATLILSCLVIFTYSQTEAFSNVNNAVHDADSLSFINGLGFYFGNWYHPTQISAGIAYLPIVFISDIAGSIFSFIDFPLKSNNFNINPVCFQLCHIIIIVTIGILLSRMLKINGATKALFLLGFSLTYPFLVFSLTIEKYVMATFCIVFLIYICINNLKGKHPAAAVATGVLWSNAVFIPYISYDRNIKIWISKLFKCIIVFCVVCVFCGGLSMLTAIEKLPTFLFTNITNDNESKSLGFKILEFINLLSACFIKPETLVNYDRGDPHYTMLLPTVINWLGVMVFTMTITGFILNRRNRFAQYSFFWFLIVILISVFMGGWDITVNPSVLPAFYFGWPLFVLSFMFFEKMFEYIPAKYRNTKFVLYSGIIVIMAVVNIGGIAELINYGIEYYPVK